MCVSKYVHTHVYKLCAHKLCAHTVANEIIADVTPPTLIGLLQRDIPEYLGNSDQ